jgi:hypothetical protein
MLGIVTTIGNVFRRAGLRFKHAICHRGASFRQTADVVAPAPARATVASLEHLLPRTLVQALSPALHRYGACLAYVSHANHLSTGRSPQAAKSSRSIGRRAWAQFSSGNTGTEMRLATFTTLVNGCLRTWFFGRQDEAMAGEPHHKIDNEATVSTPSRRDFKQGGHHAFFGAGEASSSCLSRFFKRRFLFANFSPLQADKWRSAKSVGTLLHRGHPVATRRRR